MAVPLAGLIAALQGAVPLEAKDPLAAGLLVARVVGWLDADRPDVRECLERQVASDPARHAEVGRLAAVIDWIEREIAVPRRSVLAPARAIAKSRDEAFAEILAGFIHERRLDAAKLASLTESRLTPRHISSWARVQRALAAGHDPRRVLCGQ